MSLPSPIPGKHPLRRIYSLYRVNNQNSTLLRLPAEIRNIIYEFLFEDFDGYYLRPSDDRPLVRGRRTIPCPLFNVLFVCRQLYHEWGIRSYKQNLFVIHDDYKSNTTTDLELHIERSACWIRRVGSLLPHIKEVSISLPQTWCMMTCHPPCGMPASSFNELLMDDSKWFSVLNLLETVWLNHNLLHRTVISFTPLHEYHEGGSRQATMTSANIPTHHRINHRPIKLLGVSTLLRHLQLNKPTLKEFPQQSAWRHRLNLEETKINADGSRGRVTWTWKTSSEVFAKPFGSFRKWFMFRNQTIQWERHESLGPGSRKPDGEAGMFRTLPTPIFHYIILELLKPQESVVVINMSKKDGIRADDPWGLSDTNHYFRNVCYTSWKRRAVEILLTSYEAETDLPDLERFRLWICDGRSKRHPWKCSTVQDQYLHRFQWKGNREIVLRFFPQNTHIKNLNQIRFEIMELIRITSHLRSENILIRVVLETKFFSESDVISLHTMRERALDSLTRFLLVYPEQCLNTCPKVFMNGRGQVADIKDPSTGASFRLNTNHRPSHLSKLKTSDLHAKYMSKSIQVVQNNKLHYKGYTCSSIAYLRDAVASETSSLVYKFASECEYCEFQKKRDQS